MALPRAVVEAEQRANALIEQAKGTPADPAPEQNQAAPAAQAPAAPAPQEAPAPTAGPATPAAPAPAQTPAFESAWEQKFKVLDGKYRAEVPRLHQEVKDLKAENATLREQLAAKPAAPQRLEFTAEEREQYGDDLLALVDRIATQRAASVAPAAPQVDLNPVTERMQRLERQVAETAEEGFFRKLGKLVPHYAEQNVDSGFVNWLAERDQFTGQIRQALFDDAYNALDVDRIAAFFKAYPYQSNVERTNPTQPTLEQQVAPEQSRSAPPAPAGKKQWTGKEIQDFYTQVRRGLFQGRTEEMARIEQDIFAAQQEGRVR